MPELNHNFLKGRMNLDLDERLVPDGEYREAMNVEVDTSEGSNVGAAQSVLGNTGKLLPWPTPNATVVGSIVNAKTDKIYSLIAWESAGSQKKDVISEFDFETESNTPVLVDVYEVEHTTVAANFLGMPSPFNTITLPDTALNRNIRTGMVLTGTNTINFMTSVLEIIMTETNCSVVDIGPNQVVNNTNLGPVIVTKVTYDDPDGIANSGDEVIILEIQFKLGAVFNTGFLGIGTLITFKSKRILSFTSNNLITGINIVEDLLFWTDNLSEPKKINITRSKAGTPTYLSHTRFNVYNNNGALQSERFLRLNEITVAKRAPMTPPSIDMYNTLEKRGKIYGVTKAMNFTEPIVTNPGAVAAGTATITAGVTGPNGEIYDYPPLSNGTIKNIEFVSTLPDFLPGDILALTDDQSIVDSPRDIVDVKVRVIVISVHVDPSGVGGYIVTKIVSTVQQLQHSVDQTSFIPNKLWAICLERSKALFEFKFPRFAYRYKYQDNEYSSFSPFSKVAFIPSEFVYDTKNAYNLGMVNQLRFLKIIDFVPDDIPKGVVEVDILYKESDSPVVYTIKTIKSTDIEWNITSGHTVSGPSIQNLPWSGKFKGALQIESEVIYATVPSNQLLRPWDNVPRRALAQELSANRIIYGNYIEGYNMLDRGGFDVSNVDITTTVKTADLSNDLIDESEEYLAVNTSGSSIKSLRTYQTGIVYRDEFNRESPVFTSEKSSVTVGKSYALTKNNIAVQNLTDVPDWATSYKFFIKETSNEYYNLALDRWYNAEDGSIWLSFPSAERNKVDEETYLILKKAHDIPEAEGFVEQKARYKIVAIENEAPDFIKLERSSIGHVFINATTAPTAANASVALQPAQVLLLDGKDLDKGQGGLVIRLYDTNGIYTDWYQVSSMDITNTSAAGNIKIKGTFGEAVENLDYTAPSATGGVRVEIAREVFFNKPEFQGRFFVKVADKGSLIDYLTPPGKEDASDFTVTQQAKQYHISTWTPGGASSCQPLGPFNSSTYSTWARHEAQWWSGGTTWSSINGGNGAFYIDQIQRWTYSEDRGFGITRNRTNSSALAGCHMELSLSRIKDRATKSFSIASHPKAQRDFYGKMSTEGTWMRWAEDPNQVVYEISFARAMYDSAYTSLHASGIYNHNKTSAGKGWMSNKSRRIYLKFECTGWVNPGGTGYIFDPDLKSAPPTWICGNDSNINDPYQAIANWHGPNTPSAAAQANGVGPVYWDPTLSPHSAIEPGTTAGFRGGINNGGLVPPLTYDIDNPYGTIMQRWNNIHNEGGGGNTATATSTNYAYNPFTANYVGAYANPWGTELLTGRDRYNTIQIVQKFDPEALKPMSKFPAIFETEPKEDIGLDIYHEVDQAFPVNINDETNETFAKVLSQVKTDFGTNSCSIDPTNNTTRELCDAAGGVWERDAFIETWNEVDPPTPYNTTWALYDKILVFTSQTPGKYVRVNALIRDLVASNYFPEGTYVSNIISDYEIEMSQEAILASGTTLDVIFTNVDIPRITYWSDNEMTLNTKPFGTVISNADGFFADNIKIPIGMKFLDPITGLPLMHEKDQHPIVIDRLDGGTITTRIQQDAVFSDNDWGPFIRLSTGGSLQIIVDRNSANRKIDLDWSNCYSFGNGVESDRIRDDYNAVRMGNGVKVSTTLAKKYQEERKKNSLIYSGIYNNSSGVNDTNQFIMAEKITKDLNPRHGSIQKLHAREGDLITLCEDKVFKILANKDALYNADGNPQMIATNRVLGQATPMGGEYGISTNPESFASQAYKAYFSDKSRGVILKLDSQGLIPISNHGMKDYFADNLINATKIIGSYDDKKDSYNVTLTGVEETVSYGEKTNGWTSFKSFMQEGGLSLNNNYYTFKGGNIWRHHQGPIAEFYGTRQNPYIDVLFNQLPGSVKSFGSLKYEGSQSKISLNLVDGEYYNNLAQHGWYVSEGNTNLQQTDLLEFKNKEGKWFSRIKGEAYKSDNIDLTEFSFQGIDMARSITEIVSAGCMDPTASNYDPLATIPCGDSGDGSSETVLCDDINCGDFDDLGVFSDINALRDYVSTDSNGYQDTDIATLKFYVQGGDYTYINGPGTAVGCPVLNDLPNCYMYIKHWQLTNLNNLPNIPTGQFQTWTAFIAAINSSGIITTTITPSMTASDVDMLFWDGINPPFAGALPGVYIVGVQDFCFCSCTGGESNGESDDSCCEYDEPLWICGPIVGGGVTDNCTEVLPGDFGYAGAFTSEAQCNTNCQVYGCTDPLAVNYYAGASIDDGSCIYTVIPEINCAILSSGSFEGCDDWYNLINGYDEYSLADLTQHWYDVLSTAGYQTLANGESLTFSNLTLFLGDCCGEPSGDDDVFGCMDPLASNYSSYANIDDQTCMYPTGVGISALPSPNFSTSQTSFPGVAAGSINQNQIAILTITPNVGEIIRASDFSTSILPQQVQSVKFEDTENQVYLDYSADPLGTNSNANYNPLWVPTITNNVLVIVELMPFVIPSKDLDISININKINTQSSGSVISSITLKD